MKYVKVDPPKKKGDWPGKLLRLEVAPSPWSGVVKRWLPEAGAIVRIFKRLNAKETWGLGDDCSSLGDIRVLKLHCRCLHCHVLHVCFIPESWVVEGKAVFVEEQDDQD